MDANILLIFATSRLELEAEFIKEAAKENMVQLKGHRSVGGMRASIYNAMPLAGVEKLVAFMKDFQARNAWFILKIVAPFSFFWCFCNMFVVEGGWVELAGSFEFWLYCKNDNDGIGVDVQQEKFIIAVWAFLDDSVMQLDRKSVV